MKTILSVIATVVLVIAGVFFVVPKDTVQLSSVMVGNQYQSTTTPAIAAKTNLCPARIGMASSTTGVLGSVNVLKSGVGELVIYDATTTSVLLRSANMSTTSVTLANFNISPTAGSYHFDIGFKNGLLIDYTTAGTGVSSTTISYRCEG